MTHEHAPIASCESKHVWVIESSEAGHRRCLEVDLRKTANDRRNDDLIEVGVRLKAD